jgi:hypothetical protein
VQWQLEVKNGQYLKKINPETKKSYPEYNWVWSPQGAINMHQPETWGVVQFSEKAVGNKPAEFIHDAAETCKWELRKLYYAQRRYFRDFKHYSFDVNRLEEQSGFQLNPAIQIKVDGNAFTGILNCDESDSPWRIRADGLLWSE